MNAIETQTINFQEGDKEYTFVTTQPISYRPRYIIKRNGHKRKILTGIDILPEHQKEKDENIYYAEKGRQLYRSGTDVSNQTAAIPMIGLERKLIP